MVRSKKTLLTSAFCLIASGTLFADPPAIDMARELGYSEILEQKEVPHRHSPRAPKAPAETGLKPLTESRMKADAKLLEPMVYQKAEPASMIPFLMTLQKRQPDSPKITRKLALTCLEAGQPREALYWFTQVWQRDKSDLGALWNMAALSYRLGDTRRTNDYLQEYARRDPHSAWGLVARKFNETGMFGGFNSANAFDAAGFPRVGYVEPGAAAGPEGGLMVVEGKRVSAEELLPPANDLPAVNPLRSKESRKQAQKADGQKSARAAVERPVEKRDHIDVPKPAAAASPLTQASIDALPSKDAPKIEAEKPATPASPPVSVASGS
ncbi:MAG TPA: hypothetical protein PLP29_15825 [Candidatus Ozemobacteraceae bacterium]|nr:hypothetical protein [Candidatus Ozemobacteraceae bacterium]